MFVTPNSEAIYNRVCLKVPVVPRRSIKWSPYGFNLFSLLLHFSWESFLFLSATSMRLRFASFTPTTGASWVGLGPLNLPHPSDGLGLGSLQVGLGFELKNVNSITTLIRLGQVTRVTRPRPDSNFFVVVVVNLKAFSVSFLREYIFIDSN